MYALNVDMLASTSKTFESGQGVQPRVKSRFETLHGTWRARRRAGPGRRGGRPGRGWRRRSRCRGRTAAARARRPPFPTPAGARRAYRSSSSCGSPRRACVETKLSRRVHPTHRLMSRSSQPPAEPGGNVSAGTMWRNLRAPDVLGSRTSTPAATAGDSELRRRRRQG